LSETYRYWPTPECAIATGDSLPASQLLRQPEVRLEHLVSAGSVSIEISAKHSSVDIASLETAIKYSGYLKRQEAGDSAREEG